MDFISIILTSCRATLGRIRTHNDKRHQSLVICTELRGDLNRSVKNLKIERNRIKQNCLIYLDDKDAHIFIEEMDETIKKEIDNLNNLYNLIKDIENKICEKEYFTINQWDIKILELREFQETILSVPLYLSSIIKQYDDALDSCKY